MLVIEGERLEIITQVFAQKLSSKISQNRAQNIINGENGSNFVFGEKYHCYCLTFTHRDRDVSRPRSQSTNTLAFATATSGP